MTAPAENPQKKKIRKTRKRPARKRTRTTSEQGQQTVGLAAESKSKPRKKTAKKKKAKAGGARGRASAAKPKSVEKQTRGDKPFESGRTPRASTAVAEESDFGAGILDAPPVAVEPAATPAAPSPRKRPRRARAPAAPKEPTIAEDDGTDARSSDGAPAAHGEKPTRSSRRRRRSRTQRLAEEAEVIASMSGETPLEPGSDAPAVLPSDDAEAAEDKAPSGRARRSKTRRRSRRKKLVGDAVSEQTPICESATPSDEAAEEDGDLETKDDALASPEEMTERAKAPASTRARRRKTTATDGVSAPPKAKAAATGDDREMLINVAESEECRIAILSNHRLDELHAERAAASSNVGNIYKGRVTNVEPSIQAAFIDFGLPQHGFLHISDLHPQYFPDSKGETEQVGKKTPRRQRPPIQTCLKRGSEVIVQVIKEGIGTKGPTLSSYISLPGRFLVMMPGMEQLGVSRKIEDEDTRRKMREILGQLSLPKDMGFIVRTAGVDRTKRDLQRDLNFLSRLWKKVDQRMKKVPAPAELYKESDLVIRTIRDVYDSSLKRIVVDNEAVADRVREFLRIASPRAHDVVEVYDDAEPLFHRYGIEREIDRLHSKTVPLPCGGSLVIEQTEALVAIDVNSGRFRVPENAEETAYRVNLEAVDEIARQLRLRDLGGLIICDLIDMTHDRHRRQVERLFSEALRKHKERAKILRISRFGLIEMTRQRQRPSLAKSHFRECPKCAGSGHIKAPDSVALEVMRKIKLACQRPSVARVDVKVSTAVANDMLNRKRHRLTDLERAGGQTIVIHGTESFAIDQQHISCSDRRGREVQAEAVPREEEGNGSKDRSRPSRRAGRRGRRSRG